jgi:hypothetical protein
VFGVVGADGGLPGVAGADLVVGAEIGVGKADVALADAGDLVLARAVGESGGAEPGLEAPGCGGADPGCGTSLSWEPGPAPPPQSRLELRTDGTPVSSGIYLRSDLKLARISSEKSCGCSQAAK